MQDLLKKLQDMVYANFENQDEASANFDLEAQVRFELARLAINALDLAINCHVDRLQDQIGNISDGIYMVESYSNQL